jgi:hypothetical protein
VLSGTLYEIDIWDSVMGMSTGLTNLSWLRIWAVAGFSEYSDMFDK